MDGLRPIKQTQHHRNTAVYTTLHQRLSYLYVVDPTAYASTYPTLRITPKRRVPVAATAASVTIRQSINFSPHIDESGVGDRSDRDGSAGRRCWLPTEGPAENGGGASFGKTNGPRDRARFNGQSARLARSITTDNVIAVVPPSLPRSNERAPIRHASGDILRIDRRRKMAVAFRVHATRGRSETPAKFV